MLSLCPVTNGAGDRADIAMSIPGSRRRGWGRVRDRVDESWSASGAILSRFRMTLHRWLAKSLMIGLHPARVRLEPADIPTAFAADASVALKGFPGLSSRWAYS